MRMLNYINIVKNIMISRKFAYLALSCKISPKAKIFGAKNMKIGANTVVHQYANLRCTDLNNYKNIIGSIVIGEHCTIQPYVYIYPLGGKISIGNYCSIHPFTVLYGQGGLVIGDYVRIAAHTIIIPENHNYSSRDIPIFRQGYTQKGIVIEDDVWVGANVTILDGVCIRRGCIIGAGSVVTKSTEEYGVYVGNPSIKIKIRK